jgi:hypothetical protein
VLCITSSAAVLYIFPASLVLSCCSVAAIAMPAGPVLNVLLLSWLYAYYCYDYKWALQGARLPQRLAFFEAHWAFFAGGPLCCVVAGEIRSYDCRSG